MSDELLRVTERRWRQTGALEDALRYDTAMQRAGRVSEPRRELLERFVRAFARYRVKQLMVAIAHAQEVIYEATRRRAGLMYVHRDIAAQAVGGEAELLTLERAGLVVEVHDGHESAFVVEEE
jgi:hypothetical protein